MTKENSLSGLDHFMKDIYPRMTEDDFITTRCASNIGHAIAIIKNRIELEIKEEVKSR